MNISIKRKEKIYMHAVSEILANEITNSNIAPTTVTDAKLSNDGMHLSVYVVFEKNEKKSFDNLKKSEKFVRKLLSKIKHYKFTPEVNFKIDDSFKKGLKIEKILKQIEKERNK